jgi:hypothetical protein
MQLLDHLFGRREQRWFENGAAGARRAKFQGHAVSGGRRVPVLGTSVAREGIAFVSPLELAARDLELTFRLRERTIPTLVHVDESDTVQAAERLVHRYFCTFTAIAADDWDAVVRYVDNKPEPVQPAGVKKADDEFRALPIAVQNAVVDQLVRARRLERPAPGTVPLIRMVAGLPRGVDGDRTAQDVLIHSKVARDDEMRSYDTRFRVYANGQIELIA